MEEEKRLSNEETVSMPSRAYASFLPGEDIYDEADIYYCVNALSGLCLISTAGRTKVTPCQKQSVNALSGLCLISTKESLMRYDKMISCVNALSGLCLISTMAEECAELTQASLCQCPLGLMPHFYGTPSKT